MENILAFDPKKPWLGGNIVGGDNHTWNPDLWNWIIEKIQPVKIIDVGCGEGHLVKYFYDKGIYSYGIDGLPENADNAHPAIKNKIIIHDFQEKFTKQLPFFFDIAFSCEFVEHVEEKYMQNYIEIFCHAKYVIFTHAVPGQPGHHHVNCQDDAYWIEKMALFGFALQQPETEMARTLAKETFWNTTLIFKQQ